jgi:glyoxylate reductase
MSSLKVYVTRQLFPEAIEILERHADVEVFEGVDDAIPRDLLLSKVEDVDGLLPLLTERIDAEVMDAGGILRVISNYAVGFNNIDLATPPSPSSWLPPAGSRRPTATSGPGGGSTPGGQGCS